MPEPLGLVDEGLAFFLLFPGKGDKRKISQQAREYTETKARKGDCSLLLFMDEHGAQLELDGW